MLTLATQYPQHHFFIFTEIETPLDEALKNVEWFRVQPAIKNKLSLQYWYRFKMPGLLQRKAVNIFISEAGMLCKNIPIPQFLFLRPENKEQKESGKIENFAFQNPKLFSTQITRATAVFVTEPALTKYIKNKLTPGYPVYYGLSEAYKMIDFEEKESWINANTEGFDFFVFHVSETTKRQVLPMLKAFSIFKKWTESSMKLVFFSHCAFTETDIPKFNLYKFRSEIEFLQFSDDAKTARIYASAFLHIYLPDSLADENFALHALQTHTALLTSDTESQKERFGSAAAYCNLNEKSIAEKLLYYYKSDFEKDKLIDQAEPFLKNYTLENAAAQIASIIGI